MVCFELTIILLILGISQFCIGFRRNLEENPGLFEGDIVLRPGQLERDTGLSSHAYGATTVKLWPNPVPYELDTSITKHPKAVANIEKALKEIEDKTCLRFKRVYNASESIYLYQGKGCYSHVGYYAQYSGVSLSRGCWMNHGKILHEVCHALGFYHEQARPDRDNYVDIIWKRIPKVYHFQFQKYSIKYINSLNVPYDYDSVMHYNSVAFVGGKIDFTIKTKDRKDQHRIGQRKRLSPLDALQLNLLYKCPGVTPPPGTLAPWSPPSTKGPTTYRTRKPRTKPTTKPTSPTPSTKKPGPLKKIFLCNKKSKTLTCPSNQELKITYELFGRTMRSVCKTPDLANFKSSCISYERKVAPLCNGKSLCVVKHDETAYKKDPCPLFSKYLHIEYRCYHKN